MSRTRAELMSIQALSAELLDSATCCSSLAMRSLCASTTLGAEACATRLSGAQSTKIASQQRKNLTMRLIGSKPETSRLEHQSSCTCEAREIENIYDSYKRICPAKSMGSRKSCQAGQAGSQRYSTLSAEEHSPRSSKECRMRAHFSSAPGYDGQ